MGTITSTHMLKELDEFKQCTDVTNAFQSKYDLSGDMMALFKTAIGQKPISSVDFSRELEEIDGEWFGVDQYLQESPAKRELIEAILQKAKQNGVKLLWAKTYAQVMDRGFLWFMPGKERHARMLAWVQFKSGLVDSGPHNWARASYLEGKLFGYAEHDIREWIRSKGSEARDTTAQQPYWDQLNAEWEYLNKQPVSFFEFDEFKWHTRAGAAVGELGRVWDFDIEMRVVSDFPTTLEEWKTHYLTVRHTEEHVRESFKNNRIFYR